MGYRTSYPTNPADWTDGDHAMAALEAAAAREAALREAGRCSHSWSGPQDAAKGDPALFVCYHCGHAFGSRADRDRAMGWD